MAAMDWTPEPTCFRAVAWCPWSWGDKVWAQRQQSVGVQWITARCRDEGREGVLRVPQLGHWEREDGPLGSFARSATVVSNRGGARAWGPTLVPHGYAREIGDAMVLAEGSSLIVTEHPAMPLEGWAMALGALDLRSGEVTADTRTPEQRELIETAVDMAYNGWRSKPGSDVAPGILRDLAETGLTWAVFLGSVLAREPRRAEKDELLKVAPETWVTEARQALRRAADPDSYS